jgi:hypothetical protein
MANSDPTWMDVMKALVGRAWREIRAVARRFTPSMLMGGAILLAYTAGDIHVSPWWILICMVLGGFAIGAAEDRAENRASTAWAGKFWRLIESDHLLEISVTHKNEAPR